MKERVRKNILFGIVCSVTIFFLFSLLLLFISPKFTITQNGTEVNNLTACCIEIKNIDYFENYSTLLNYSRTITYYDNGDMEGKEFCIPEEQNILGLDCKIIDKSDLDKTWLNTNSECYKWETRNGEIINYENYKESIKSFLKDYRCLKYKFGEYEIQNN